jgi:uncharacterized membrane protein YeaQ/YmgE (transglycosylase-associated protein family)
MHILGVVIAGFIIGALAKLVMPGRDPGGFIVTTLLGIVGTLVGWWIGRALGFYGPQDPAGWIMSILGAIVLLSIYRFAIAGGRTRAT